VIMTMRQVKNRFHKLSPHTKELILAGLLLILSLLYLG
jgi:hypothetical protein